MNPTMTKIQIPMELNLRRALEARSKYLGFDSIQAFFRFWAKAEVDDRVVDFGESKLSPAAIKRYDKMVAEVKADKNIESYSTVDEFMKDLV
jgi:hypothetical protein